MQHSNDWSNTELPAELILTWPSKRMETCVAMATILGDNDPINILLALIAVQSTLAIAIAFTKADDKKEAAEKNSRSLPPYFSI